MLNMLNHVVTRIRTGLLDAVTPSCNTTPPGEDINDELSIAFRLADIGRPDNQSHSQPHSHLDSHSHGPRHEASVFARLIPSGGMAAYGLYDLPPGPLRPPPFSRTAKRTRTPGPRRETIAVDTRARKSEERAAALWTPPPPPPPPPPAPPSVRSSETASPPPRSAAARSPQHPAPALRPRLRTRPALDLDTILDIAAGRQQAALDERPAASAPRTIPVRPGRASEAFAYGGRSGASRSVHELGMGHDCAPAREWRSCARDIGGPTQAHGMAGSIDSLGYGSGRW